jgi:hypothetical protein
MQYTIVTVNTANSPNIETVLIDQVNRHIQAGWEPIGGVSTYIYRDGLGQEQLVCYQALIKRD